MLIVVLVCLLIALNIKSVLNIKYLSRNIINIAMERDQANGNYQRLRKSSIIKSRVLGRKIKLDLLLSDENGKQTKVSSILCEEENYFLRIPKFSCSSCNEKIINNYNKIKRIFSDNIKLLCSYSNARLLYQFKRINGIEGNTFNYLGEFICKDIKIENMNTPFILNISKTGVVKDIIFINKRDIEYLYDYYEDMCPLLKNVE